MAEYSAFAILILCYRIRIFCYHFARFLCQNEMFRTLILLTHYGHICELDQRIKSGGHGYFAHVRTRIVDLDIIYYHPRLI